jgi:hypothetical protein
MMSFKTENDDGSFLILKNWGKRHGHAEKTGSRARDSRRRRMMEILGICE